MAASNAYSMSTESFKMPSEPCPLPSLGSDEESFVVLWKDMDSKSLSEVNHEPIGTNIIEEAKQLINKELSEMEKMSLAKRTEAQTENNLCADGPCDRSSEIAGKAIENCQLELSTGLPKMPQVERGIDTPGIISITTLSTELTTEQVQNKVSEIVEENIRLKDTILQNNMSMKSQYKRIVAWQEDVQKVHQAHKEKIIEAKEFIDKLKKENYNLVRELEQSKASKISLEEEMAALRETLREREQLTEEKLRRSSKDNINEFELDVASKKVRELELAMKNMTVENVTLKEDIDKLISARSKVEEHEKEIVRLQTALQASRRETEEARAELTSLKSADEDKLKSMNEVIERLRSQLYFTSQQKNMLPSPEEVANVRQQLASIQVVLTQVEHARSAAYVQIDGLNKEILELKAKLDNAQGNQDEMYALKAQLDVYKADFEAEKSAKETIKAEKDRLSEDMQNLQRRNQQLQEEIELLRENEYVVTPSVRRDRVPAPSAPATSNESPPLRRFACPICNLQFRSLRLAQDHVETCIAQRD